MADHLTFPRTGHAIGRVGDALGKRSEHGAQFRIGNLAQRIANFGRHGAKLRLRRAGLGTGDFTLPQRDARHGLIAEETVHALDDSSRFHVLHHRAERALDDERERAVRFLPAESGSIWVPTHRHIFPRCCSIYRRSD